MSVNTDCYNNIIGLSRTECTCYETDKPIDFDTSDSGLYLDELEPLDQLSGLDNCEKGSVWEAMEKARENAIRFFIQNTNSKLMQTYKISRQPFKGGIGQGRADGDLTLNDTYKGVRIFCNDVRGGQMVITQIGTLFNSTGTISLLIYNNLGTLIDTVNLNTVEDKHTVNNVNIELPLHSDYINNLEYYFVYTTGTPRNNKLTCGCDNYTFEYDCVNPYFHKQYSNRYNWAKWVMPAGFTTNKTDFSDIECEWSDQMNGLTFNVELKCKVDEVLCDTELDWTGDPIAASIAHAIWYKAGEILLRWLVGGTRLNRQSMMNNETMEKFMIDYSTKYDEVVNYIIDNANIENNDCLKCRDIINSYRQTLLA